MFDDAATNFLLNNVTNTVIKTTLTIIYIAKNVTPKIYELGIFMKKKIEVFNFANIIMNKLSTGILLTTKANGKVNSMTIGWGELGVILGKPVFIIFIRENRFTKKQLTINPEFTINIPLKNMNKKILGFCGTKSGKDIDKIKELNLTLEPPDIISVPAIKEFPLTIECKVIYKKDQLSSDILDEIQEKYYPQGIDSYFCGRNKDFHTVYYGEIISSYIVK